MARTRWDECPVGSAKSPLCLWLPPTPTSIWRRLLDKPKRHCLKGRLIYPQAKGIWRAVAAALSSELSASPVHECVHNRTTRLIALFLVKKPLIREVKGTRVSGVLACLVVYYLNSPFCGIWRHLNTSLVDWWLLQAQLDSSTQVLLLTRNTESGFLFFTDISDWWTK